MEKFKGTKGKWFLEESDLSIRSKAWGDSDCMGDYRGNVVADLAQSLGAKDPQNWRESRKHAIPEILQNAKLIAAAPCLLEALEGLLSAFEYEGQTQGENIACHNARKAINKALGE